MKLRTMRLLSGQAVRSLKKTPSVTSIIVVMACMIVLSSFMLVAVNLTHIGSQFQADVQIRAFLVPDLPSDAVFADLTRLCGEFLRI
jgi:cell division protein FtsX